MTARDLVVTLPALLCSCALITDQDLADRLDLDGDGVARPDDCDDTDPAVGASGLLFVDADEDGAGGTATATGCPGPGLTTTATDCSDSDPSTYPGAPEACDGRDNDCDGTTDEDVQSTWYFDGDGDGYGVPEPTEAACDRPSGYAATDDDCDDADPTINPATSWYVDADRDGFGDATEPTTTCVAPAGTVADATDCDDTRSDVSPASPEACEADDVDEDCDALADDDDPTATGQHVVYADDDGDGLGTVFATSLACDAGAGHVENHDDCDDSDPAPTASCGYAAVSAGTTHTCAVRNDGAMICWGAGSSEPPDEAFVGVSAGAGVTCGIVAGGALTCWGSDSYGTVSEAPTGTYTQVSVGLYGGCALATDGTISCWGESTGVSAPMGGGYTQVERGELAGCALAGDGTLAAFSWASGAGGTYTQVGASRLGCHGLTPEGEITDPDDVFAGAIPAGPFVTFETGNGGCAIDADGALTCWGGDLAPPAGVYRSVSVSDGNTHACAIDTSGEIACWGYTGDGATTM